MVNIVSERGDSVAPDVILTVIVPTFNAHADLPRLLNSLNPTSGVEVIFVDDGSTDSTRELLTYWSQNRPDGRIISLDHGGPGRARSAGLAAACGKYVTFADSDDEVDLQNLVLGAMTAASCCADVVIFGYEEVARSGRAWPTSRPNVGFTSCHPARVLLDRAAIWGKVYRREFLRSRKIDFEPLRIADDVIFSWELASSRPRTICSERVAYRYYTHEHDQLTRDAAYSIQAVASLAVLVQRRRHRGPFGQLLAGYAWLSGTTHILRKARPGGRLHIAFSSAEALLRNFRGSQTEGPRGSPPKGEIL